MTWPEAWAASLCCESAVSREEARALWRLGCLASLPIVEIGTWRGRTAVILALASRAGNSVRVCSVDPFLPWINARGGESRGDRRLAQTMIQKAGVEISRDVQEVFGVGLPSGLEMIQTTSLEATSRWQGGPIGLLFVDGDHSLAGADVEAWLPFLPSGSVVAFHDYVQGSKYFAAVVRDVDHLVDSGTLTPMFRRGSLYVARRS